MSETEVKKYPPSASRGGNNAYYIGACKIVGHQPAYAACLAKLEDIEKGTGKFPACADAARHGLCQAKQMRAEEIAQGKALYFVPRESICTPLDKSPAWSVAGRTAAEQGLGIKTITPAAPPIPKPAVANLGGSYADAINEAMKDVRPRTPEMDAFVGHIHGNEQFSPPNVAKRFEEALKKPAASAPAMQPGETPLAYARRVAASR